MVKEARIFLIVLMCVLGAVFLGVFTNSLLKERSLDISRQDLNIIQDMDFLDSLDQLQEDQDMLNELNKTEGLDE